MSKLWVVKHKGANLVKNIAAYSLGEQGHGWFHPKAVHAFTRRKYAKDWLDINGITHYEILGIELPQSTQDARKADYGEGKQ